MIRKFIAEQPAWALIIGLTIFRLLYIIFIPITPQEAYYWYYVQYPALSYFDHPPMAAYSIGLGTTIFGDNSFGVKFMAVIWFALINGLFLKTLQVVLQIVGLKLSQVRLKKLEFLAVGLFNLTVFAHLYAVLTVPDTPLLFFWALSLFSFLKLYQTRDNRWWLIMGMALGFGLVSKYTMVAFLPFIFISLIVFKDLRFYWKTIHPYFAMVLMLLLFSPVIVWNAQHDWASFAFQFSHRAEKFRPFTTHYIVQLFFSQLALLTPLIFWTFYKFIKQNIEERFKNRAFTLLFLSGFFIIAGFVYVSLRSLVKMNWLLPGYLGWLLGSALIFPQLLRKHPRTAKSLIYFSLFLLLVAHALQLIPNIPLGEGNTWSGWKDAAQNIYKLQQENGGKKRYFIFANSYKSASLLKFYLPDHQDTYAQNVYGRPALQFDIWGLPDSLKGKNAFYVFDDRREYKNDLKFVRQYFDTVYVKQVFNYSFLDRFHTRTIYCYEAINYHGPKQ